MTLEQATKCPTWTGRRIATSCVGPALGGFILGAILMAVTDTVRETATSKPTSVQNVLADQYLRNGGGALATGSGSSALAIPIMPSVSPAPPTPEYLKDTAIVTLATGDTSARLALTLMKSLRDAGTQVPNLVVLLSRGGLGSADCNDGAWKKAHEREDISCASDKTIAPEIASQQYLDSFDRLGVKVSTGGREDGRAGDTSARPRVTHRQQPPACLVFLACLPR